MKHTKVPVVFASHHIVVVTSVAEYDRQKKRWNVKDDSAGFDNSTIARVMEFESKKGYGLIFVCVGSLKGNSLIDIIGVLVHESVHIWQKMCRRIEEHEPSREFEAYAIEGIAEEVIRQWAQLDPRGKGLLK